MSLKIYLDDCIGAYALIGMLQAAGHDVLTSDQASLAGHPDSAHLARATVEDRVLLTTDAQGFKALHDIDPRHCGIFAICQDNDTARDMSYGEIVRSVQNIIDAGVPICQH